MNLKRIGELLGLGVALLLFGLGLPSRVWESPPATMAQPSQKYVLIIVGAMSFPANIVAMNIAEEAISDFRSLGYEPVTIYVTNRDGSYDGILGGKTACRCMFDWPNWWHTTCGPFERTINNLRTEIRQWLSGPDVTAIVLIAHGVTDGLKCGSGFFMFKGGEVLIEWPAVCLTKKFDYVILHSCCQDNEDTRALFSYEQPSPSPPGSDYPEHCNPLSQYCFKGHTWLASLIADLIWQWKRFPSEGPHEGTYLPIDLDKLMGLSTEQMAAIDPEEFDIPDSAEDTARQAFYYLAVAHNALISGYETDAMELAAQAYELLLDAYNEGWEMAKDVAHELGVVLGIEQPGPQPTSAPPEIRDICVASAEYHLQCVSGIHYGEKFAIRVDFSDPNGDLSHVELGIIIDGEVEPGPYPYDGCEVTVYGTTKIICDFDVKDEVAGQTDGTLFLGPFILYPRGRDYKMRVNVKLYDKAGNTDYDYIYATAHGK
jgi:hypothetical protein